MARYNRKRQYTEEEKNQFAAQREATMQSLSEQLKAEVGKIQDDESFRRYLEAQAQFHNYSPRNTFLILCQRPDARRVAGYETWQQLGRQVRKGERGIKIYAPMTFVAKGDDGEPTGESRTRFRLVTVFDVSQTEGEDIPELTIDRAVLAGEDGTHLYDALALVAQAHGFTAPQDDAPATIQKARNLARALAFKLDAQGSESTDIERVTVAEAAAFLVLTHYSLDTGDVSFKSIALWTADEDGRETLTKVMNRIQKIARALIDQADERLDPEAAPQCLERAA